jgi:hypothetical protein
LIWFNRMGHVGRRGGTIEKFNEEFGLEKQ